MINALGLLEVDGMVATMDAADAMLKAANVRLLVPRSTGNRQRAI
ncbi:BMC domain-containing protein [Escherichia coli]